jgi:hypothetical protein
MKFLQFPWRWLLALSLVDCVLVSMALDRGSAPGAPTKRARWPAIVAFAIIVAMTLGGAILFFQPCDDEDAVAAQLAAFRLGQGTEGTDEYTPVGVDNTAVQQQLPLVRVLRAAEDDTADSTQVQNPVWRAGDAGTIPAKVESKRESGEHWEVSVVTPEAGYAVLRLMDYPAWRVTVDGRPTSRRPLREDGLMAVAVTAGSHAIDVQWTATRDVIAGREISAIALLALAVVGGLERKSRRASRV